MARSNRIMAADASALIYAVAVACEETSDPRERLVKAINSGCELIGARTGSICYGTIPQDGQPLRLLGYFEAGHWTSTDRRMLAEYYARADHEEDLVASGIADVVRNGGWPAKSDHAVLRHQVVDDRKWYRSSYVNDFRRVCDTDDCIYAGTAPSGDGKFFGLTFHRCWGESPFREKDRVMVDTLRKGIMPLLWSYERSTKRVDPLASLPPRMAQIAGLLLAGKRHKDIAKRLGLAVSTIRTSTHKLHQRLGVHSHAEFVALVHESRNAPL